MAVSTFDYQYKAGSSSIKKKIGIGILSLALLGTGVFTYQKNFTDKAQVNRLVSSYYLAESKGDSKKLASMESKVLKKTPGVTLGASTDASDKTFQKPATNTAIVATKLGKSSGAITGRIATKNSKDTGIPFLATVVKEDGKWKINLFNVGLVTKDDYTEGSGTKLQ